MDVKRTLADFSRMKVDILKDFLRKRGLKATGRKDELVALAFSAEQLELPLLKLIMRSNWEKLLITKCC